MHAPKPAAHSGFRCHPVHVYEKYADSASTISHVTGFLEKWAERFMACVDVSRFVVYGSPNAEARGFLDAFGGIYMGPWAVSPASDRFRPSLQAILAPLEVGAI